MALLPEKTVWDLPLVLQQADIIPHPSLWKPCLPALVLPSAGSWVLSPDRPTFKTSRVPASIFLVKYPKCQINLPQTVGIDPDTIRSLKWTLGVRNIVFSSKYSSKRPFYHNIKSTIPHCNSTEIVHLPDLPGFLSLLPADWVRSFVTTEPTRPRI